LFGVVFSWANRRFSQPTIFSLLRFSCCNKIIYVHIFSPVAFKTASIVGRLETRAVFAAHKINALNSVADVRFMTIDQFIR